MTKTHPVVFLFDVDNTQLDNDSVRHISTSTWNRHIKLRLVTGTGRSLKDCGANYLGALERFRVEAMHRPDVLRISSWLVDYSFADRLYPGALDAVKHVQPRSTAQGGVLRALAGGR